MGKSPILQGKWIHPEIDNPEYVADDELYLYKDFGAIGIDIWQVKSGTIFDNILVTDSIEEAKAHAKETFEALSAAERTKKEAHEEEEKKRFEEEEKKRKEEKDKKGKDEDEEEEEEEDDDEKAKKSSEEKDHDEL